MILIIISISNALYFYFIFYFHSHAIRMKCAVCGDRLLNERLGSIFYTGGNPGVCMGTVRQACGCRLGCDRRFSRLGLEGEKKYVICEALNNFYACQIVHCNALERVVVEQKKPSGISGPYIGSVRCLNAGDRGEVLQNFFSASTLFMHCTVAMVNNNVKSRAGDRKILTLKKITVVYMLQSRFPT